MSHSGVENLLRLFHQFADNLILLQEQAAIIERDATASAAIRQACGEIVTSINQAYGSATFIMNQKDHDAGTSVTDL
ncbi:hypothetical protein HFN60_30435 [Rhizobium leguminosarum]|uniref:hypothetical protein n=1 Tax=Rhizobium leguminosarum TaxID=384 RepID=UPI001C93BBC0|nr:hypothetical protein [Rhizobium leguminosarum]MBY5819912.1 hypothetical protein [Rhizobium leguminosarum]